MQCPPVSPGLTGRLFNLDTPYGLRPRKAYKISLRISLTVVDAVKKVERSQETQQKEDPQVAYGGATINEGWPQRDSRTPTLHWYISSSLDGKAKRSQTEGGKNVGSKELEAITNKQWHGARLYDSLDIQDSLIREANLTWDQ